MKEIEANYVDVIHREIYPARIVYSKTIVRIERKGDKEDMRLPYCMPGFVDSHVHIESSMLNPQRFATMVMPKGTIAVVCDPHEIANVCGIEGVRYMMRDAGKSPMKIYFAIPSCVPATSFETNGAIFDSKEIEKLITKSVALAEMMNYPGIVYRDPVVMRRVEVAHKHNRPVDGHAPGLTGEDLKKYVAAGITTDHECVTTEEALEKIALGMKILVRDGSAARNYEGLKSLFNTNIGDLMVCTDDANPADIMERGHIDKFYNRLIKSGLTVFDVYKPLLLTPIEHYKLQVGRLQVGDMADFIVSRSLEELDIREVVVEGRTVYAGNEIKYRPKHTEKPNHFIDREFTEDDFKVVAPTDCPTVRVIQSIESQIITDVYNWMTSVGAGQEVEADAGDDIAKIAVVNRYAEAPVSNAFIRGTGLKAGAVASSVAHDSHNVVILGSDKKMMAKAAEEMFKMKGGFVVALPDGRVEKIKLPIAGLMTNKDYTLVARQQKKLVKHIHKYLGVTLDEPFMTLAFMSLLVIPKLKIGDKGLFDVEKFGFTELFE